MQRGQSKHHGTPTLPNGKKNYCQEYTEKNQLLFDKYISLCYLCNGKNKNRSIKQKGHTSWIQWQWHFWVCSGYKCRLQSESLMLLFITWIIRPNYWTALSLIFHLQNGVANCICLREFVKIKWVNIFIVLTTVSGTKYSINVNHRHPPRCHLSTQTFIM